MSHDDAPRPARYGSASTADVGPALLASLLGDEHPLDLPPARAWVLVVVDGLGWRQLREHADDAPFLAAHADRPIDAAHPSTTATNLTCLGTGLAPGRHGVLGYTVALPDDDRPFNLLSWRAGPHGSGASMLDAVPPEDYQPHATVFERGVDAGVDVVRVMPSGLVGTGLSRAGLRGGRDHPLDGDLDAQLHAVLSEVAVDGQRLVYLHHGALDAVGHAVGAGRDPWREELRRVDAALAATAARLPRDVRMLVTADHGMLAVDEATRVSITDHPGLMEGVRVISGEARARQLHTRPGRVDEVVDRWCDALSDRYRVLRREEAVAEGWYGDVDDRVLDRIGDVLVWATGPHGGIVNPAMEPKGGKMLGMHGSITRAEVEVPAIVLD